MQGAFYSREYRNVFAELGYDELEIEKRLEQIFQTMFYGSEAERVYYPVGDDMGFMTDTGNHDVRTEGMSYGMMMCVQLDKKEEFDRIWKWVKTYMWMPEGINSGYFAWSCDLNGNKNSYGPAPDGEEFFAMALFFAANRWGNGEGIFHYTKEARDILHTCVHKGNGNSCIGQGLTEGDGNGYPMWEPYNRLIKFIPECDWSDPSYHLPHFYELFALWANEEDRAFWKEAAVASREYLKKATHPETGLCAEYATYDGSPFCDYIERFGEHDKYFSDAYRVALNIGLDYAWFGADDWECECAKKIQRFFCEQVLSKSEFIENQVKNTEFPGIDFRVYEIDGTILTEKALHPVAIIATNAAASLAVEPSIVAELTASTTSKASAENAATWVRLFWDTPLRTGNRRYYDNCLYLFSFMALSGNYRVYM